MPTFGRSAPTAGLPASQHTPAIFSLPQHFLYIYIFTFREPLPIPSISSGTIHPEMCVVAPRSVSMKRDFKTLARKPQLPFPAQILRSLLAYGESIFRAPLMDLGWQVMAACRSLFFRNR